MQTVAIVPAYNEAETVGDVVKQASDYVDDVIVVDDGSTDDTASVARRHGGRVIEHAVNTGVGGALRTGYRYAVERNYAFLVQIDADGQHDPEHIPAMLEAAKRHDIVIGSRYLNDSHKEYSLIRQSGVRFFTRLVNALGGIDITDVTSGFRIYSVGRLPAIVHNSDTHWAVEQTLEAARLGYDIEEVSVEMPTRSKGRSQFSIETFIFYPVRMTEVVLRILIFR